MAGSGYSAVVIVRLQDFSPFGLNKRYQYALNIHEKIIIVLVIASVGLSADLEGGHTAQCRGESSGVGARLQRLVTIEFSQEGTGIACTEKETSRVLPQRPRGGRHVKNRPGVVLEATADSSICLGRSAVGLRWRHHS